MVVDHRRPHKGDFGLFWDSYNYDAVCKPCHDSVCKRKDTGTLVKKTNIDGTPDGW